MKIPDPCPNSFLMLGNGRKRSQLGIILEQLKNCDFLRLGSNAFTHWIGLSKAVIDVFVDASPKKGKNLRRHPDGQVGSKGKLRFLTWCHQEIQSETILQQL
jgi:hypothetical protein